MQQPQAMRCDKTMTNSAIERRSRFQDKRHSGCLSGSIQEAEFVKKFVQTTSEAPIQEGHSPLIAAMPCAP